MEKGNFNIKGFAIFWSTENSNISWYTLVEE